MAKNTNRRMGRGLALHYGADISGCPIERVPDVIPKSYPNLPAVQNKTKTKRKENKT
jgi:hypothetical protein